MKLLLALRLLGFILGAALQLSLFLLIKRYRRIGKLELLFLSLITCLFVWNFSNILSQLFLTTLQHTFLLLRNVETLEFAVLAFLPSLLLHTHLVFQQKVLRSPLIRLHWFGEAVIYSPLLVLPWAIADFIRSYPPKSILTATIYARPFAAWFSLSLLASVFIEWKIFQQSQKREERNLYRVLMIIFLAVAGLVTYTYYLSDYEVRVEAGGYLEAVLILWSTIPSALLGYYIFRHSFLEIAIQPSFRYSFAGILLLLVYLLSVQRLRDFVEATYGFPGPVVEVGLILALLAFSQPLKRWIDASVDTLFSLEISKFQKMATRLDEVSRSTAEMDQLLRFIENLLQTELDLRTVVVSLYPQPRPEGVLVPEDAPPEKQGEKKILLSEGAEVVGEIRIQGQSGKLSTEQQVGLRFLVTQIVAAIQNCKLAEGKIRLERELAERDKMATLGQMAATVAHNIKNPLSSIKTIVQLMQEDDDVRGKYSRDLELINGEIDRLNNSVAQLLKFSKPTFLANVRVDLNQLLQKVDLIFKPEADQKGILLAFESASSPVTVMGSEEILSEIFQNLIVNAIEVSPKRSRVLIRTAVSERNQAKRAVVSVEDEGPGISPEIRQHIFKPFFTTKQKGTGLGLAVVHRRLLDLGGEIDCISPLSQDGGTRFEVNLPWAS